jgi:hypothetical protein
MQQSNFISFFAIYIWWCSDKKKDASHTNKSYKYITEKVQKTKKQVNELVKQDIDVLVLHQQP